MCPHHAVRVSVSDEKSAAAAAASFLCYSNNTDERTSFSSRVNRAHQTSNRPLNRRINSSVKKSKPLLLGGGTTAVCSSDFISRELSDIMQIDVMATLIEEAVVVA